MFYLLAMSHAVPSTERISDPVPVERSGAVTSEKIVAQFLKDADYILAPYSQKTPSQVHNVARKISARYLEIYFDQTLYIFDLLYHQRYTLCDRLHIEKFLLVFFHFDGQCSLDNIDDALYHLTKIMAKQKIPYYVAPPLFESLLMISKTDRGALIKDFELFPHTKENPTRLLLLLNRIHPKDRTALVQKTISANLPLEEQENYLEDLSAQSQIEYFLEKSAIPKRRYPLFDKLQEIFYERTSH